MTLGFGSQLALSDERWAGGRTRHPRRVPTPRSTRSGFDIGHGIRAIMPVPFLGTSRVRDGHAMGHVSRTATSTSPLGDGCT